MYDSRIDTYDHIRKVSQLIYYAIEELLIRAQNHDQSKLHPPELEAFDEFTPGLKNSTYGSDEYRKILKDMKPAIKHHNECNRHHPEHFKNGIRGMHLIDLLEMMLDWKAASMRHADGDIRKSIDINKERFNISPCCPMCGEQTQSALEDILRNTVEWIQSL